MAASFKCDFVKCSCIIRCEYILYSKIEKASKNSLLKYWLDIKKESNELSRNFYSYHTNSSKNLLKMYKKFSDKIFKIQCDFFPSCKSLQKTPAMETFFRESSSMSMIIKSLIFFVNKKQSLLGAFV